VLLEFIVYSVGFRVGVILNHPDHPDFYNEIFTTLMTFLLHEICLLHEIFTARDFYNEIFTARSRSQIMFLLHK
jgi:hypothetical protein